MLSPFYFPVNHNNFNFVRQFYQLIASPTNCPSWGKASVIFGAVTIFGIMSWYFIPEEKWLSREQVLQALHAADLLKVTEKPADRT
jgi:translation initiation factor 5B